MQISDILHEKGTNVITIKPGQSMHEAIGSLNEHRIGALIVTGDAGQVVGIITERDVLRKCGERCGRIDKSAASAASACSFTVQDAMTTELVIGVPEDDPDYAMGVMTKNRIRHLPILDKGKLTGIISIGDLVNAHLEEMVIESRTLKDYLLRNSESKSG